jgi:hypothetical protein
MNFIVVGVERTEGEWAPERRENRIAWMVPQFADLYEGVTRGLRQARVVCQRKGDEVFPPRLQCTALWSHN